MSKVKKVLAIILSMAMILGMSLTTFAATGDGEASIKVTGLTKEETTVSIYKVVSWDQSGSAWAVETWAQGNDEDNNPYVDTTTGYINWGGLREDKLSGATAVDTQSTSSGEVTFAGLDIGAYLIVAGGTTTQYQAMGTFTYKYDETSGLMVVDNKEINAKGSNYTLTKNYSDGNDSFVKRGDTIVYNIDTIFPSFEKGSTDRTFTITDTPTNITIKEVAVYVGDMENALTENTDYTLSPAENTWTENTAVTVSFTSEYLSDDSHAASAVRVVVTAEVTGVGNYSNAASSSNTQNPPTPVEGKTGSITVNKIDESGEALVGATFSISSNDTKLSFVKVEGEVDTYKLATPEELGDENVTKYQNILLETGTLVVKGLDEGTYTIIEEKAPDGYSTVNINPVTISNREGHIDLTVNVTDTKLHQLPSTGGIGTTIFTIGGCAIMIAAAGLYFASRRKQENK